MVLPRISACSLENRLLPRDWQVRSPGRATLLSGRLAVGPLLLAIAEISELEACGRTAGRVGFSDVVLNDRGEVDLLK